jgi:hypothetical protein
VAALAVTQMCPTVRPLPRHPSELGGHRPGDRSQPDAALPKGGHPAVHRLVSGCLSDLVQGIDQREPTDGIETESPDRHGKIGGRIDGRVVIDGVGRAQQQPCERRIGRRQTRDLRSGRRQVGEAADDPKCDFRHTRDGQFLAQELHLQALLEIAAHDG